MAALTAQEIIEATGGKLLTENSGSFSGVSIDSRTIDEGNLFIALRGDTFDGHAFLADALVRGRGAMVDSRPDAVHHGKVIIHVQDTLRSLQDVAYYLRMKRDVPVIAVTGSNGKTTTKEMIHSIISRRCKVLKNEGNLNNHIGLPLSLTRVQPDDEVIVLEMGMNAAGEIRRLCEIAVPTHGIITNIGTAHLGRLGSYEAVRAAKLEIIDGLQVAVVNADDTKLMEGVNKLKKSDARVLTFAIHSDADVIAHDVRTSEQGSVFMLALRGGEQERIQLNVLGAFNVYNALAAAAVSSSLGIRIEDIKRGLESYRAFPMRFEMITGDNITIINDSYNANPSSIKEALNALVRLKDKRRTVAVLGDMQELDGFSEDAHREIGREIINLGIDVFIAVGPLMNLAVQESEQLKKGDTTLPEVFAFQDSDTAGEKAGDLLQKGDIVLLKGSRIMAMERIIEKISDAL